jgi:phosphoglycolate phosphatase
MAPRGGEQASETPLVSLVCCGLIGTTVCDDGMIEQAYSEAIATQGVVTGTAAYARCMAQVHRARGRSVIDILQILFPESQARAQAAQLAFDRSYSAAIDRSGVTPVPGSEEAVDKLAGMGAKVCLITGLSRRVTSRVLDALGWWDRVDLVISPDDVPRGCPAPDLVLSAMLRLGIRDVRDAAVAHATEAGVLSGRRSGAGIVAGVLTGIHTRDRLRRAGATHLLPSVAALPDLLAAASGAPDRLAPGPADPADRPGAPAGSRAGRSAGSPAAARRPAGSPGRAADPVGVAPVPAQARAPRERLAGAARPSADVSPAAAAAPAQVPLDRRPGL